MYFQEHSPDLMWFLEGAMFLVFLFMRFLYKFVNSRSKGTDEEVIFLSFFVYDHYNQHYRVIHPNWLKVLSYNFVNKWFYQKMKISHCWKFMDVYAGTLICPRSQFFASQIIFFHSWQWAKIGWLLWSCYTAQFWPAVFVPTQLFNELS